MSITLSPTVMMGPKLMWMIEVIGDSSGFDDCDSDTDEHCDVVWAKAGRGVWGLCHVFENTLYLTRDLMEDSAVPSNLFVQRCLGRIGLPLLPVPRTRRAPSPVSMFSFSA